MCFFTSESIGNKVKFLSQINNTFCSGGMTSSLENNQLVDYFQYLQRSQESLPIKKGVLLTGQQANGIWVLNEKTFLSPQGEMLRQQETDLVWLNKDVVFETDKIRSIDITPSIKVPLTCDVLFDLVNTMEVISQHNFIPSLVVISGIILSFHYETIVDVYGGCPVTVAVGEPETGKSSAIRAGLALGGMDEKGRYVKGTNAALMERSSRSTLPFCIEEAGSKGKSRSKTNFLDLPELIIDLYNGAKSANLKTGSLKPKSIPVTASNFDVDEVER